MSHASCHATSCMHACMGASPAAAPPPSNLTACVTASMHAAEAAHACSFDTMHAWDAEDERAPEGSPPTEASWHVPSASSRCEDASCVRRLSARASSGASCVLRCSARSKQWLQGCARRWCARHASESARRAGVEASGTCTTMACLLTE